jgi:hypothetical protein
MWRGFPEGVTLFRVTLEELSACDCGCRFELLGCGGLCWLDRGLLGLGLLGLISLLLDSADLHAAFQDCSILYADPVGYHIARQRALAANIQAVRTLSHLSYRSNHKSNANEHLSKHIASQMNITGTSACCYGRQAG